MLLILLGGCDRSVPLSRFEAPVAYAGVQQNRFDQPGKLTVELWYANEDCIALRPDVRADVGGVEMDIMPGAEAYDRHTLPFCDVPELSLGEPEEAWLTSEDELILTISDDETTLLLGAVSLYWPRAVTLGAGSDLTPGGTLDLAWSPEGDEIRVDGMDLSDPDAETLGTPVTRYSVDGTAIEADIPAGLEPGTYDLAMNARAELTATTCEGWSECRVHYDGCVEPTGIGIVAAE